MISVVCATNDEVMLKKMLVASLKRQTNQNYELIVVDSKKLGFTSSDKALNYGASLAKGEILMFVHQDVELISDRFLDQLEAFSKDNDFGIAGVCGVVSTGEYVVYSSVIMGTNHIQAGRKNTEVRDIYALDECLFIIKKKDFVGFDDLGKTWHFYAVDYSIRCHQKNKKVLLFPLEIYHLSPGWSLNYSYFDTLLVVAKKYPDIKKIKTCMGVFSNNLALPIYCSYRKFKLWLKKILKYK